MCGFTGIIAFNDKGKEDLQKCKYANMQISSRGPDSHNFYFHNNVALGHTRLSIIDVSEAASQPFTDSSGRYTIVYNGEIYNFTELRKPLLEKGIIFRSQSDTEVLLYLYIAEAGSWKLEAGSWTSDFLSKLNGFFAFAIYDKVEESIFIARDRFGIKPLLYYKDEDKLIFASEMKALLAYGIPKEIDYVSLNNYLQFNYIPAPNSIFKNVYKLTPGSSLLISKVSSIKQHTSSSQYAIPNTNYQIQYSQFYKIPYHNFEPQTHSYSEAQKKIVSLLDASVKRRLIADVPLGAFLSGGIDSSIIVALASRHTTQLDTFSIGFKDEPMFDETYYARLVADKYKTNHTEFSLTTDDIFSILYNVLDYTDEPYADSSALAVYILSKQTRKHVTVALSGDGADELFGGYNKYLAEYKARQNGLINNLLKLTPIYKLLSVLPQSRNTFVGNKIRQINRYAQGIKLNDKERYWRWCAFIDEAEADKLLSRDITCNISSEYDKRKRDITQYINNEGGLNDILYSDMHLVLQNDMLTKVDMMSMANSLEVRVPFLDHELVNYVFTLPSEYKINSKTGKKILKDAFRKYLPDEVYNRPKHGFEVPLLKWFKTELKSLILNDLLNDDFIIQQNIFNLSEIQKLKKRLFSNNPGDVHAQVWGLIVFQYWWKKIMNNE